MRLSLVFDEGPGSPGVRDGSHNRLSAGVEIDLDRFGISLHRPWLRSQLDVDVRVVAVAARLSNTIQERRRRLSITRPHKGGPAQRNAWAGFSAAPAGLGANVISLTDKKSVLRHLHER